MYVDTNAFFDELTKIADMERDIVTKERVIRALKAGLAAAGGMGLGWGLGNLAADTILPAALQRFMPNPTAEQLSKAMFVASGLGAVGSMATDYMKAKAMQYIREGDKKPQDMLMGHERLNPEHYGVPQ